MIRICSYIFTFVAIFGFTNFVHAQFEDSFLQPQLSVDISPQHPRPGEEVKAVVNDYGGGAYGSSITWVLNGQAISEAKNQRQAVITAGEIGTTDRLQVVLTSPQGIQQVLNAQIRPVYLDIILEPQTRTPDFYQGRSLPSIGSIVNVTALVNNGSFIGADYLYTWRVNQTVIDGGPLRGGKSISFPMPMGDDAILSLEVSSLQSGVVARRSIIVPSVFPDIKFYEVSSLYGINNKIVRQNSVTLIGNTLTLQAEPFNLDSRTYNNPPIKIWNINGQEINNSNPNPYLVSIQRNSSNSNATIGFHVRDTSQVLQGARNSVQINY